MRTTSPTSRALSAACCCSGLLLFLLPSAAQEPPAKPAEDAALKQKVEELIGRLAHEDFDTREKASADLTVLGPRAVPYMEAHEKDEDQEIVVRLRRVLAKLRPARLFENPFHRAQVGDWAEYRMRQVWNAGAGMVAARPHETTVRVTVTAKDDQRATIRTESTTGPNTHSFESTIDFSATYRVPINLQANQPSSELEVLEEGKAEIEAAGKKRPCQTAKVRGSVYRQIQTATLWYTPEVPVHGLAKLEVEMNNGRATTTYELTRCGRGEK